MTIVLHNTLTGRAELFRPQDPERVTMYVCGPTVYGLIHVGNARSAVVFDLLYRLLRAHYPEVRYVRNITDVDDKIIRAARAAGESPEALAGRYAQEYREDVRRLNALAPTAEPLATAHIAEMIELVRILEGKGHAYAAQGHVLFDESSHKDYGELSNRRPEDMVAGSRVEVAPYKRNAGDFVLWKPAGADEPGWDSPWGRGRPGWHLECSAMAGKHLGSTIDIHGGGQDLVFPHHENESAQSRCAHGTRRFANYWIHNGLLTMSGNKMAKSAGNIVLLREALAKYHGEVVRYALLSGHYRKPLDWSEKLLSTAKASLDRLYLAIAKAPAAEPAGAPAEFVDLLRNDMNTPAALAALHDYATRLNKERDEGRKSALRGALTAGGSLLGVLGEDPGEWFRFRGEGRGAGLAEDEVDALVAERAAAKRGRDYGRADAIRAQLKDSGVLLEDSRGGTVWRWE